MGASTVAEIFEGYLRELGIAEFPCGTGEWRNNLKWESDLLDSKSDISAELFTVERLLELSYQKPFHKEIVWSRDAKTILHEAIKYPQKTRLDNIHKKFKTLRMVGKNISRVDEYITKFENLEELVLSANSIKSLNSKLLPRGLRGLELSGNQLHKDVDSLCISPPRLQHIGISHNNISTISTFIRSKCWNSLLSLDLSFNDLENVFRVSALLKELPKLRNLHLIGNPLYLFMGHRGYIVDTLPLLTFLDEVNISANERHLFKGMNELRDLINSQFCVVNLKLDNLKGFIKHEEVEQTEELFKTIVRYHVELDFLKECFVFNADEMNSENVNEEGCVSHNDFEFNGEEDDNQSATTTQKSNHRVIKSNDFNFTDEEMELIFKKYIVAKDAMQLMKFLSNTIEIRIIKNVITMSDEPPPMPIAVDELRTSPRSVSEADPTGKSSKKSREKPVKRDSFTSTTKPTGTKMPKPKKVKNAENLYEVSRVSNMCAKVVLDCRSMFDALFAITKECTFEVLDVKAPDQPDTVSNHLQADRGKNKKNRKPSMKQEETKQETKASTKTTNGVKGNTNKAEVKFEDANNESEVEESPPEPPSLQFGMQVVHWNTANEGFDWLEKHGTRYSLVSDGVI